MAPAAGRQRNTGRAGQGPDRVEARVAGELDALRRLARRAGAEQHVDPVEQRIDMGAEGRGLALGGDIALEGNIQPALHRAIHQLLADLVGIAQPLVGVVARAFVVGDGAVIVEDVGEGRGEGRIDHRRAFVGELARRRFQERLGVGRGLVPDRRAAEADARPGNATVDADRRQLEHGAAEQRDVVERARHQAQRVDRVALHLDADPREVTEGRLVADHAAIGGGADHRAAGLRAEGERHVAVGDRGGRARGRAARRVGRVVRVGRRAGMAVGEFRGHRLAQDDGVGGPAERHAGGVAERHLALEDRRVVPGRHVVGVDDVLHPHRHAAQHAAFRRVGRLGLRQREVGIEIGPRLHGGLALGDALEAGAHQRLRGERAGLDPGGGFAGAERLHASALRAQAAMFSRAASSC